MENSTERFGRIIENITDKFDKIIKESKKKKEANRRAHSKPGAVPYNAERDKHVLKELE